MNIDNPKVTVIMPVYNGELYLREAIESILSQTFTDFEFLIINDGSIDSTRDIILSYNDPRIRLVNNAVNIGLNKSLNIGINMSKGEYIARMDGDDISIPSRFLKQVEFMDRYTDIGVCGTWVKTFGDGTKSIHRYPSDINMIKANLIFRPCLAHPSVIIRKKLLLENKLYYNETFYSCQDYEFWTRCACYFFITNIREVLLFYRINKSSISKKSFVAQQDNAKIVRIREIMRLGFEPTEEEILLHEKLKNWELMENTKEFVLSSYEWLLKLKKANETKHVYPEPEFSQVLAECWFLCCRKAIDKGNWTWYNFWTSEFSNFARSTFKRKIIFHLISLFSKFYIL